MKIKLFMFLAFFIIGICCFSSLIAQNKSNWDISYYKKYSLNDFKKYAPANSPIDLKNIDYALINAAVFYETNRMRVANKRKEFTHSQALENAAQMHSKDMVDYNFFDHTNYYDSKKRNPDDRMAMFNVTEGYRGENIATAFGIKYNSGDMVSSISDIPPHSYNSYAEILVNDWMNSPGHRANILDKNFTYLGCGNFYYNDDGWPMFKATQCFGSIVPEDTTNNSNSSQNNNNIKYEFAGGGYFLKVDNELWESSSIKITIIEKYYEYDNDGEYFYLGKNNPRKFISIPINGGIVYYWNNDKLSWEKLFNVTKSSN